MKKIIGLFCKQQTLPTLTEQEKIQEEVKKKAADRYRAAVKELREASINLSSKGGRHALHTINGTYIGMVGVALNNLKIPTEIRFNTYSVY